MVTLTDGQNVHTSLTIEPGQVVLISGDRALSTPPTWGSAGFTLGESASLALAFLTLAGALSASVGANQLTVADCVLVGGGTIELQDATAVFTGTDFGGRSLGSTGGSVTVTSCSGELHSISMTSGGSVSIITSSSSIGGITVMDSAFALDAASTVTLGGSLSLSNAGNVNINGQAFYNSQLSVSASSSLSIATASGSIGGITVTGVDSTFALDATSNVTFSESITVQSGAAATIADCTMTFTGSGGFTAQSDGHITIVNSALSFPPSVHTGLTIQSGAAATTTGTTFNMNDDGTVAVSAEEGATFIVVDSQLVKNGVSEPFAWSAEVALCECGGHGRNTCNSPAGDCQCDAHGMVDGHKYPAPWTGTFCETPPDISRECCSTNQCPGTTGTPSGTCSCNPEGCGGCTDATICCHATIGSVDPVGYTGRLLYRPLRNGRYDVGTIVGAPCCDHLC